MRVSIPSRRSAAASLNERRLLILGPLEVEGPGGLHLRTLLFLRLPSEPGYGSVKVAGAVRWVVAGEIR